MARALREVTAVEAFLIENKHVGLPAQKATNGWENPGLEPRIEHDITVKLNVNKSDGLSDTGVSPCPKKFSMAEN